MIATFCIIAYLIVAILVYIYYFKDSKHPTWEKIGLSIAWILLLPLWLIHKLHML